MFPHPPYLYTGYKTGTRTHSILLCLQTEVGPWTAENGTLPINTCLSLSNAGCASTLVPMSASSLFVEIGFSCTIFFFTALFKVAQSNGNMFLLLRELRKLTHGYARFVVDEQRCRGKIPPVVVTENISKESNFPARFRSFIVLRRGCTQHDGLVRSAAPRNCSAS